MSIEYHTKIEKMTFVIDFNDSRHQKIEENLRNLERLIP
jgi:hypothetical protein